MASFWENIGLSRPANVPAIDQGAVAQSQRAAGLVPLTPDMLQRDALLPDPSVFDPTYDQRVAQHQAELERLERLRGALGATPAPGLLSTTDIGMATPAEVGSAPSMSTFALPQSVSTGSFDPTLAASNQGIAGMQSAMGLAGASGNMQQDIASILANRAAGDGYSAGAHLANIGTLGVNRAFLDAGNQSAAALQGAMQGQAAQLGAGQGLMQQAALANAQRQANAAQAAASGIGGPAGAAARLQAANQGAIARAGAGGEVNRQLEQQAIAQQMAQQRAGLVGGYMQQQGAADAAAAREQMGLAASQLAISDQLAAMGLLPGAAAAQRAGDQGLAQAGVGLGNLGVAQDAMLLGAQQRFVGDLAQSDQALANARLDALGLNAQQRLAGDRLGVGFDTLGSEAAQHADRINMGIARDVALHNIGQGQQFRQGQMQGMLTVNDMITGQADIEAQNRRLLDQMQRGAYASYADREANRQTGNQVRAARRYATDLSNQQAQTGAWAQAIGTAAATGVRAAQTNPQQSTAAGWQQSRS